MFILAHLCSAPVFIQCKPIIEKHSTFDRDFLSKVSSSDSHLRVCSTDSSPLPDNELTKYKNECDYLSRRVVDLSDDILRFEEDYYSATSALTLSENRCARLESLNKDLMAENDDYKRRLESQQSLSEDYSSTIEVLNRRINDLTNKIEDLQHANDLLENEKAQVDQVLQNFKGPTSSSDIVTETEKDLLFQFIDYANAVLIMPQSLRTYSRAVQKQLVLLQKYSDNSDALTQTCNTFYFDFP